MKHQNIPFLMFRNTAKTDKIIKTSTIMQRISTQGHNKINKPFLGTLDKQI